MTNLPLMPLLLAILLGGPVIAQQKAKPVPARPKTVDVEVKEPIQQAGALFEAGQKAHQSGDLEKAVELYAEALKRDPSLWPAEFQRSVAYLSLGRLADAHASIDRVFTQLAEFSDSPELRGVMARAQLVRGEIALAEGKRDEAETAFRRTLELNPKAGPAHAGLAEILLASDKTTEAAAEAKAAIEAGDDRSSTWTVLGTSQMLSGQNDEALASLDEAIKRNSKQVVALRSRAQVNVARGKFSLAIADLRAALAIDESTAARLNLASVLSQSKQYPEAIELLQTILKAEPENAEARAGLAAAMIDSGKAGEAIAQLESLIKAQPGRADLHAQLGELYLASAPERGLTEYGAAAKIEPGNPRHQIGIATALVRMRRFQDAVPILRQVLTQNPKDDIAYFAHTNLATALFELDDFAGAGSEYVWILKRQQVLGDRKRAAITLYFLGICLDKLGDFEQALKAYDQFLALASPDNQLEIDKVKLRLPSLRRQIQAGQSNRKKN
jgi:tetratricopeptide (TPR) repeat protein